MFSTFSINSQEDHNDLTLTQNQTQLFPNFDPDNFNDLLFAIKLLPNNKNNNIGSVPQPPLAPYNNETEQTTTITDLVGHSSEGGKRTMRRDRHSKIVTAKGPRDRRMRLSLDVAKKFFDLQDLLGFDKASKTVEWLLTKSRHAIRSLTSCGRSIIKRNQSVNGNDPKMESFISRCEEEDEEEQEVVAVEGGVVVAQVKTSTRRSSAQRVQRKVLTKPKILKESRIKARERARERTMEKRMSMLGNTRFDQDFDLHGLNQQANNTRQVSSFFVDCGEPSSSAASIPTMMRMMMGNDEHEGIASTFDYNCNNNNNFLNHVDPFNIYQENWNNFYPPSVATAAEEQQNIINHNIHQRGWDVFNNQSSL